MKAKAKKFSELKRWQLAKPKIKKILTTLLKVVVSIAAVGYLVYSLSPDEEEKILSALTQAHWGWLFIAFLLFNLSKITSSIRLNRYFKCIQVVLEERFNLKLYYLIMATCKLQSYN